ncbi:hypothetical protein ABKV19_010725, partial [Rosa sericea]
DLELGAEIFAGGAISLVVNDRFWSPHAFQVKLNCSSFWVKSSCKVGLCVIARDADRSLVFSECELGVATSAPDAEAKACLMALRLATEQLVGRPFVLESHFFRTPFTTFEDFGASLAPSVVGLITQYHKENIQWSKCERFENRTASRIALLACEEKLDENWRNRLTIVYE